MVRILQVVGSLMSQDEFLTVDEVATQLRLTKRTTYRLAAEGKIPSAKVGGSVRIPAVAFQLWLERVNIQALAGTATSEPSE